MQKKTNNSDSNNAEEEASELEKVASSYRKGWAHAEVAFQYGAAIIVCTLAGYWIDSWLNTGWIFTIAGAFTGATGGFILLLKTLKVLDLRKKGKSKA